MDNLRRCPDRNASTASDLDDCLRCLTDDYERIRYESEQWVAESERNLWYEN